MNVGSVILFVFLWHVLNIIQVFVILKIISMMMNHGADNFIKKVAQLKDDLMQALFGSGGEENG